VHRAAVGEHTGIQAREWSRWLFTKKRKVNEKTTKPCISPSRNHDSAAARQHPLICTGAGPIHPVHGPPKLRATKAMTRNEVTFSPFSREFSFLIMQSTWLVDPIQLGSQIRPNSTHRSCDLVNCRLTVSHCSFLRCRQTSCQTWANSLAETFERQLHGDPRWETVTARCDEKKSEMPKNIINLTNKKNQ